ncbi:hypothetical protein EJ05DRAFT_478034 [Pseudovirgaria hyperparasitica]|uniref:MaoC-like domain-containing protein n=1 Tax=Pseudovirgaria hyperparasitica TaxID=470096 RepID=A0A6A6W0F4_9PEZI|nr:uncharacterized protein EJ05DRAFT_478034 [Pseudovirgaria hyperparasitica]KAF2755985.1 hypothetical protein EJ05DRAFT_478034 [Pseudovirgaria hyperparasitica]
MLIVSFIVFFGTIFYLTRRRSVYLHATNSATRILPYSPNTLNTFDLFTIILDSLLKYVPGQRPSLQIHNGGFLLPRLHLGGILRIRKQDLNNFNTARGIRYNADSDMIELQTTNPMFLVAATTPLLLLLLSHADCPIQPLGSVNTTNKFNFADLALCRDVRGLLAASKAGELTFTAVMGGEDLLGKRKRRGVEFEIVIEVWKKGALVLSAQSSFLQFLSKNVKPLYAGGNEARAELVNLKVDKDVSVKLPASAPRHWAACSKDYNPIHVSNMLSKLFGFSSVVAHGNHVVALLVENIGRTATRPSASMDLRKLGELLWAQESSVSLDVSFVKPVTPLPIALETRIMGTGNGVAFGLFKKDVLCVTGSIS